MSRVAINTAANYVGSLWGAAVAIVFVPVYVRYLGMEAYGLIGVSATIALILALSDFGISAALTREMAREWKEEEDICEGRRALETLARLFIPLSIVFGSLVVVAAPYIATSWVRSSGLSVSVVETSLRLIGLLAVFQLVSAFYSAALLGLQRQVLSNVIAVATTTIQAAGAILLLEFYSADIVTFFSWQTGLAAVTAIMLAVIVNLVVPGRGKYGGFDGKLLRKIAGFALGMSGISLLTIVLTQTDKVVMSKLLSLEDFGYYSLAALVATSLKRLFGPLFAAVYPRFTEIARNSDAESLERLYHLTSQAMTVVVLPASLILMLCSAEVVFIWTGDAGISSRIRLLIALLVFGTALNGLAQTPYAVQLAHGWTRLALLTNSLAALVFVPSTYFLGKYWGGEGAAVAWVVLNVIYVGIQIPIMHRRLLRGSLKRWYLRDILLPGTAAVVPIVGALPLMASMAGNRFALFCLISVAFLASVAMAILAASELRAELRRRAVSRIMTA